MNKVLIKLYIPEINQSFDIFIPVNEIIWKIKKMITKSISDITSIEINQQDNCILINKNNDKIYKNNELVISTDIRNGTELLLCSNKKM